MLQSKSIVVRSISIAVTIVFLFVSILANTESVSAASKLKLTVNKRTIYVGQTAKFKANRNVKWSVTKKKIAKLSKIKKRTVTVKGLKAGTVYVMAKAGKKTKKIKITVKAKPTKKMRLKASKKVIGLGEYSQIFVEPEKTYGSSKNIVFSSSDKTVATVSNKGLVTGVGEGSVTITVRSKKDKKIKASIEIDVVAAKAGVVTLKVDLSDEERYPSGKVAKVWLPVPQNDDYQYISAINFDAPGAKVAELTNDSAGGKQLYIEWGTDANPADRKAVLTYHLYRRAIVNDGTIASKEKGTIDKNAFAVELSQTYWSGSLTSGIVKQTADKIVADAGAKTVYEKAFAIYNYICDNMTRIDNKSVIFGDVVSILEGKRDAGSCMDMNSVFVALCRAEGIPARNLFGLRFTSAAAPGKPGPNCRAEFYVPGYGWASADPALAVKQSWGHESEYIGKNAPNAAIWEAIKDKYWVNAEENWICVNMGRDIWLNPRQSVATGEYREVINPDGSINLFMFPYGEFDGVNIPCQKAAEFKYEYEFSEEDPTSCGC